jgi:hypothetical protein
MPAKATTAATALPKDRLAKGTAAPVGVLLVPEVLELALPLLAGPVGVAPADPPEPEAEPAPVALPEAAAPPAVKGVEVAEPVAVAKVLGVNGSKERVNRTYWYHTSVSEA